MHGKGVAALVAAAASIGAASPIKRATSGFSVTQVEGDKVLLSGPVAYRNALAKYHATIPSHVQVAAAASQSGSVTANPSQNDSEYLCPVTVGNTQLNLDFDTGSADLWVFSTELPSSQSNGHTLYDPSSGQKEDGETWNISYGDGSGASGDVYADTVVIGGVTATSQAVEAATSVSGQFESNTANNGLVGLAFSSINTVKPNQAKTFFDTVSDSLPEQLFTVTLKKGAPGSYDFGYIDDSKHTGDITYVPVDNSQGFWSFTVDSTSVSSDSLTGIADTGTTLILVDDSVVQAYYQQVSGATNNQQAGGYVFDCNTTPPDFTLTIGGADFVVPGSFINFAPNGDGTCFGGIQSNQGIGFNIFGDVFLKNQFVVFDAGQTRLGFAPQTGGDSGSGDSGNGGDSGNSGDSGNGGDSGGYGYGY